MKNRIAVLAAALVAATTFSAAAQNAPGAGAATPGVPTAITKPIAPALPASEQDYFEQEALLVNQLRLLDLQVEIAERQKRLSEGAAAGAAVRAVGGGSDPVVVSRVTMPDASNAGSASTPAPATVPFAGPPRANADLQFIVTSIWGADESLEAQVLSHGLRMTVRAGDALPGGWTITRVARTGLILSKGKATRTVTIGG